MNKEEEFLKLMLGLLDELKASQKDLMKSSEIIQSLNYLNKAYISYLSRPLDKIK
ncbi:hypothetical protein [Pediococcus pentosaceus]|uniref:hypothetical protein n=1 Tax=Pediococcus pentosaceus TaxID=1255 RepID=UPI0021A3597B|nr:hypothetical protein [Pediococcus pentosaceus]